MKNAGLAWSTRGLAALVVTVAAIAGDFSLTGKEVGPVMKVLQDNGVQTVALHSHALNDVPRLFYMHFWANDDALKLATTLRSAIDRTNSKKGQ